MSVGLLNPRSLPTGFDHLIYLRVIEACNLYCRHCFIPGNPKRLRDEDFARIPDQLRRLSKPGQTLLIQLHGGEPTLIGADMTERLIGMLKESIPDRTLRFGIQTNLMSYDRQWARVYNRHFEGEVGVSWDVDIRQTKRQVRDSNREYEDRFWPKMNQLLEDGLTPYLVVTATRLFFERFRNPADFFAFLTERGIRYAHIERLTPTGYAIDHWSEIGVNNQQYASYMARFARSYRLWNMQREEEKAPRLSLSPFDGLFESVASLKAGSPRGYGCWSGSCDTRFHTIDAYGYTPGCTALTAGRSKTNSTVVPITFFQQRQQRRDPCRDCEYRPICSSGCLGLDAFDDSGECAGGLQLFQTAMSLA
jgi:radical SAM protein with 4Fe4S-binding SPASM domain